MGKSPVAGGISSWNTWCDFDAPGAVLATVSGVTKTRKRVERLTVERQGQPALFTKPTPPSDGRHQGVPAPPGGSGSSQWVTEPSGAGTPQFPAPSGSPRRPPASY